MRPDWGFIGFVVFCTVMMLLKKLRPSLQITRTRDVLLFYNSGFNRAHIKLFSF